MPSQRLADARVPALAGGGEMGARMRAFDWSQTSIGPAAAWPQSLKTAVRIILTSRYAMFVWWGRELINLYNDPYRSFLGVKHPDALGKSARDVWAEIWDQIGPRTDAVLLHGESTYDEALLLLMERYGYLEETYFTFSYSPLPDDQGNVAGLFCAVTEDTQRVIGDRRLRLLREMASAMAEARTPPQVCRAAAQSLLSAQRDLPFSLIYLVESDGKTLKRVSHAGIASGHLAAPELVSLDGDMESVWPFRQVIESGEGMFVERLGDRLTEIPTGDWAYPPERAVLVPIAQQGQACPAGVFIAGLNPHRQYDEEFRGFVSLLTNQIAAGIANAAAYDTVRRRADALAQLDRAKTLFFSNVSHEFRTPLTLLLGPLENVLAKAPGRLPAEDQEQIAVARRNALRLLKLVNTLLDFSRLEAGRAQAFYEPTDLSAFTAEIASVFRSAMESAGLRFSVQNEPLPEPVYVDREMWEKIVLNLLSNAFKFTFEGEISVRLRSVGDAVELAVEDTGVGISQDELPRVFERFHRIESARARTYEGTGIGLALVQELVKLHGGTVRAESAAGRGSVFIVSIPKGMAHRLPDRMQAQRASAPSMSTGEIYVEEARRWLPRGSAVEAAAFRRLPPPASRTDAAATQRELIVLADDNADMREYAGHLLREQYEVHAVSNGAEAVEATLRFRPALVLTDVMMPLLDGFGVLRAIRDDPVLSGIPVILLSARAGEESRIEGLQAGADDYLIKPFTARELLARVGTHVRMAKIRRDAVERETVLRAQAELERHRLQELLAQAPALIGLMSGPDHRWIYVNDLFIRVTGRRSAEDFLGKTMRESLPELEGQGLFESLDQVYRTGQPLTGREMRLRLNRSASGQPEEAYFNFVYQPIRDAGGKIDGVLAHAVEVTDQVAARKVIAMSEERLRMAQTAAQIGTWEWDAAQDTRTLSPELHRIFGTDAGDPQYAQVWESRVHPADWPRVSSQMEAGSRSGSMEFEYRYHHPEHGLRWFLCKGRRLDDQSRMLGVLLDITRRKQAELRSAAQHNLSRVLADSANLLQAVPQILRSICEVFDWNLGALWVVNQEDSLLSCLAMWCGPQNRAVGFEAVSRSRSFPRGVGLPGRIWATGEPLWVPDVLSEKNFPRSEGAHAEGLHAAFGFPVLLRDRVLGVMEFFSREIRQPDDALLHMMASVSTQIGQYIERVQAQDALRDSEERYRTMTETASDAIVSIDEQSTILFANSAIAQVFGYLPEELLGKNLTMLMPDYMRRVHDAGLARYVGTGQRHLNWDATELPGLHKDGRTIALEVSFGEYVKDGQHFFTGFARDITGRKQVAEAHERLAAIVESSDDAIVGKDLNGIVTSWNAGAERMFGYKAEEIIGRSIIAIVPPELHDDERRILETIARGERIHHYETVRVTKDGERIFVSLTISPVRDGTGRIVGAAKIARNITEQKRTEQTLHTAERLASVGRLAATVAHEINNPLEAVTNLVYLAKANAVQKNVREYLSGAEEELERISQLTKQTLGFYRNTKGATPMRIGPLVEALLSVYSSRIRNKSIEVRLEIRQDPEIVAVPGEIRQLFANLLSNSIDAVVVGDFIRIRVSAAAGANGKGGSGVRLTVADTGPGIPSAVRSKLFEPFFTTKKDVGTGLGLWVCKSIIEKHGGNIHVQSSVRTGRSWTAFSVFLPQNPPLSLERAI